MSEGENVTRRMVLATAGATGLGVLGVGAQAAQEQGREGREPEVGKSQGQDKREPGRGKLLKEPDIIQKKQGGPRASVAGAALVSDYGFNIVGPRSGDVLFRSTGWNIADQPTVVMCQPRQGDNINFGFPDQFSIQVIETHPDSILFRVQRIDADGEGGGWGQNLRVDILVIN